jgi:hypothetical protein
MELTITGRSGGFEVEKSNAHRSAAPPGAQVIIIQGINGWGKKGKTWKAITK